MIISFAVGDMVQTEKTIKLNDLIDIEFLQEFQDFFAKTMDVASIAIDDNGPITKPSNFNDFCGKFTRGNPLGLKKCNECDVKWGKLAAVRGEPVIYKCYAGLTVFSVPIIVSGMHIASILGGLVFTELPSIEYSKKIAKELDVDENEYMEALSKVNIVPMEKIEAAAKLLFLVANAISKIGHKRFKLFEQNKRESLYRIITETIRSTLDIDETKQRIIDIVGKTLGADRCYIVEYNIKNDTFLPINDEYLSSDKITSYKESDINVDVPNFAAAFKNGKSVIVNNKEIFIGNHNKDFESEKNIIEKYNINSAYGFPLYHLGELLGVLSVHYVEKVHTVSEDEITLLNTVANQISLAIYQAKLYRITQIQEERERLLGKIIIRAISTFDLNQIKHIVKEVGILTRADRCYFVEVESEKMKGKPIDFEGEYRASDDIKTIMGYEFQSEDVDKFVDMYLKTRDLVVFDYEALRQEKNEKYMEINRYSNLFDLKSGIGIPFIYMNKLMAVLCIEYVKEKVLPTDDELNFLRILGNQAGMAYNQVRLYNDTKETAEREAMGRNIIEIMRSTLDKNTIKQQFVKSIGKYFEADRVFFADYNPKANMYFPVEKGSEYLSSDKEKSFVGYDWSVPSASEYIQPLLEKREIKIYSWNEYIRENPKGEDFIRLFEDSDVKSSYNFPVMYQLKIMGYFCIEFTQKVRILSDEDIRSIRSICSQAGIALYHADLYLQAQEAAKYKGECISSVSNDFLTPLNIIMKTSEQLYNSEIERDKQIEYLNSIKKNCMQLMGLTSDIMNISENKD